MSIDIESPVSVEERDPERELASRLAATPLDAGIRGLFINMLDGAAGTLSAQTQAKYRARFPINRVPLTTLHPVRDYVSRMHAIASLHFGPEGLGRGLGLLQTSVFDTFSNHVFGRHLHRLLGYTPGSFFRWCRWMSGNRQVFVNYGSWSFERTGNRHLRLHFVNEYIYIEHAMAAALGHLTLRCGHRPSIRVELQDRFNGHLDLELLGGEEQPLAAPATPRGGTP